jgi:hypothetical protein
MWGGWSSINHDYKHIYLEMKYRRNHNYNQMINKHKPTLTFAKSSSIQTVHTLVKCMRSQLVSIAIVTSILK